MDIENTGYFSLLFAAFYIHNRLGDRTSEGAQKAWDELMECFEEESDDREVMEA